MAVVLMLFAFIIICVLYGLVGKTLKAIDNEKDDTTFYPYLITIYFERPITDVAFVTDVIDSVPGATTTQISDLEAVINVDKEDAQIIKNIENALKDFGIYLK